MSENARSLLGPQPSGAIRWTLGKLLEAAMRVARLNHYDDYRLEKVHGMRLLVLPSVSNPKLLRTGAFFAECLDASTTAGRDVLDMGTGSGVCALFAARHAQRVVAVDINRAAVRCARINAAVNHLDHRIDVRHGDLFEPVVGERFDLVLFNPPFLLGAPRDERDAAWRSSDLAGRFAASLDTHLAPRGAALLLLSTFGDACELFVDELRSRDFLLTVHARRHFVNETVTLLRVTRSTEK
jgi:release factor glutamine methyltransferase